MRALTLLVALLGSTAYGYDGRIGDAVIDLRSGLVGSSLDLTQMILPKWRTGVTLTHAWNATRTPFGLGAIVGYEHHQRGYALIPRARITASMGLLRDGGLGVNAQLSGGFVWYVTRSSGLGVSVAGNLWGNVLSPDATLSLVQRW